MSKEPFSFSRNLKIFIVVLICLPIVGGVMLLFQPKAARQMSIEVLPAGAFKETYIAELIDFAENEGGKVPDEYVTGVIEMIGNVKESYRLEIRLIADRENIYFVNPFLISSEESLMGVEITWFKYSYSHYWEGFDELMPVKPASDKLAAIREGNRRGLMLLELEKQETALLTVNYDNYSVYDGVSGFEYDKAKIIDIQIDLAEDNITDRIVRTEFAAASAEYRFTSVLYEDDIIIRSRLFADGMSDTGSEIIESDAESGENKVEKAYAYSGTQQEKGAYFKFNLNNNHSDLIKLKLVALNETKTVETDENGSDYPAFAIGLKISYEIGE